MNVYQQTIRQSKGDLRDTMDLQSEGAISTQLPNIEWGDMPGLCKVYEAESDPLSECTACSLGEQGTCRDQGTESGGVEMQQVPSAVGNS